MLRVVTLNLWARHGDWAARRELLVAGFLELRPSLVALQETVVADYCDQALDVLGRSFSVVQQRRREADGTGMTHGRPLGH